MPKATRASLIGSLLALALPLWMIAQPTPTPDSRTNVPNAAPAVKASVQTPSVFGTTHNSYVDVPANAFLPYSSTQGYDSDNFGAGPRWPTGGGFVLVAPLHLPSGALITYLELDFDDTSTTSQTFGTLNVCSFTGVNCVHHPAAGGGATDCLFPGFLCSGTATNTTGSDVSANLVADGITVDNFHNSYSLRAEPQSFTGLEKVDGMIVGYILQVSPNTATQSFADVPVASPQHRFIEALVATGITAGCGGGNFCPDQAVTRGQMAVFLASALGLQFQ